MKLGRNRPPVAHAMHFARYAFEQAEPLPTPPDEIDLSPKAAASLAQIYDNDRLGDCVIAGCAHIVGVETANAGREFIATDEQIIRDYERIGGYRPNDPSTDGGCDEVAAIKSWKHHGCVDGTKIAGAIAVDGACALHVQQAFMLFENLMFAVELPDAWIENEPSESGFVWDVEGPPNPSQGHCVVGVGYNADGVIISTWGMLGIMTWAAVATYAVESAGGALYALVSHDMLMRGQRKAPNGFAWSELLADFAQFHPVL